MRTGGQSNLDAPASAGSEPGTGDRSPGLRSVVGVVYERYLRLAPRLIAGIALLLGLLTLVDALFVGERYRVHAVARVIPVPASSAATAVVFVSGLLLIRLAAGLRRRKHRAWVAAVLVSFALVAAHLFRAERRWVEAVIGLVLLLMLLVARPRFTARSDEHSRWFAVRFLLQSLLFVVVYGLAFLYLFPHAVRRNPGFGARLHEVFAALVGLDGPVTFRTDRIADILHGTLLGFALVSVLMAGLFLLRPAEPISRLSVDDEVRLRALLAKQGQRDSLGYFALRRDKSVVWSASGKAAVTYRVVFGVALVSGDPIGDPEAWPGAIIAYRHLVEANAWTPAVMGCSETGAVIFRRECGLNALELGDEAVVEVADFSLGGRAMRGVRQACTRVERAGYEVAVRRMADIDPAELEALQTRAEAWRGDEVERGFSMALSRLGDPADGRCVLASVTQEGAIRGLLHFVPWGEDGLSLDLMRRDRTADNGLNEFLIVTVLQRAAELGVSRVSLNFAVFREALERGERIGAGPVSRGWRGMLMFASRWWQIESLYRFNAKFGPQWERRFISYPTARDLPRIAVAAMEAEAFLVQPKLLRRLVGRPGGG